MDAALGNVMGHSRSLEQKVSAPIPGNYDYASALADDIFSFNRAYPRLPIAIERTVKDRLVQAEVLPISAWKSTEPPRILGRALTKADSIGFWFLHVWAWKPSPSGLFAPWNPDVKCLEASSMSH